MNPFPQFFFRYAIECDESVRESLAHQSIFLRFDFLSRRKVDDLDDVCHCRFSCFTLAENCNELLLSFARKAGVGLQSTTPAQKHEKRPPGKSCSLLHKQEQIMRNDSTQKLTENTQSLYSNPSDVVFPLSLITKEFPAIPLCRVSGKMQESKGNLDDQEAFIRKHLERLGITILPAFRWTGKGKETERMLHEAVTEAKRERAVLVPESFDRMMRSQKFDTSFGRNAKATPEELQRVHEILDGVKAYTVYHPDLSASEVISLQTKRGQTAKENRGGHPRNRKNFRERWMEEVFDMHIEGFSLREISSFISQRSSQTISHVSIRKWLIFLSTSLEI